MTFDTWVKRLETIFGQQAKWSSRKEDEELVSKYRQLKYYQKKIQGMEW